jgi:NTE family protein
VARADQPAGATRTALVLSGGGARGAYEAGVLGYIFEELPERIGRPVHFDIVTGTSVGAVHACYLAAHQDDPAAGADLASIWRSLSLDKVFAVGAREVFGVPWRLLGFAPEASRLPARGAVPERLAGLFDTAWLEEIVLDHIGWKRIRSNIDEGRLAALAIAATEIGTGRSVVFVDNGTGQVPTWSRDPFVVGRAAQIGPAHALASAAIPLAFPAVRIGRTFYSDGGLRMNTPLSPALRLGADKVLVIGLRHPRPAAEEDKIARSRESYYSNPTFLAGKALDALLLDRVDQDVDRLRLFNGVLKSGIRAYGPDFMATINEPIVEQRGVPYRIVEELFLQPSVDLGQQASRCLAHQPRAGGAREWLSRSVVRYLGRGGLGEADLLSFLFFDSCFAEHLLALGRAEAEAAADELVTFFESPSKLERPVG